MAGNAPLGQMIIELGLDSSDFGKGLQSSKREVKTWANSMKSEMNAAKLAGNKMQGLEANFKGLTKVIEAQKKQVDSLKKSYEGSFVDGKATAQTEKLAGQLKQAESQLFNYQNQLKNTAGEIARTKVETEGWTGVLNKASDHLVTGGEKISKFGQGVADIGGKMTTGITLPIIGLGAAAIKASMSFEDSMSQLQYASKASGEEMSRLRELAIQMGEDTIFSAKESGEAMVELAKGGMSVAQIEAGGLKTAMDLAAAGNIALADAAEMTVQGMNMFNIEAEDSSRIANALAGGADASTASVESMGQALSQVGTVANTAGWSVEDTTAAIAAMADAGIQGSDAGTSLKSMLQRLSAPTSKASELMADLGINLYDADGNMKSMTDVAQELQDGFTGLSQEQQQQAMATIFGSDAVRAATVFMNEGSEGLGEYKKATEDATAAQEAADAQMSESARNWEELQGSLETLSITVGEKLLPIFNDGVKYVTDLVDSFGELSDEQQNNILKWAGIAAAAGPVLTIAGKGIFVFGKLTTGVGKLGKGLINLMSNNAGKKAMKGIADSALDAGKGLDDVGSKAGKVSGLGATAFNPWVIGAGLAVAAIGGIGYAIYHEATEKQRRAKESVEETDGAYQSWFDGVTSGIDSVKEVGNIAVDGAEASAEAYKQAAKDIQKANADIQNSLDAMFDEGLFNNQHQFFKGDLFKQFTLELDEVNNKMKEFGASEEEIARVSEAFNNYGTMLGNASSEVMRALEDNIKVTPEWASAQIQAVESVTTQTITSLQERRQAELDALEARKDMYSPEQYQQEIDAINARTQNEIYAIQTSQQSITDILTNAAKERRELTEGEALSMILSLNKISEATGESLTENDELMAMLGDNMELLTSKTAIESMARMGILNDEAIENLKNAETTEEAMNIVIEALDRYGAKELPPKKLDIDTDYSVEKIEDLLTELDIWNNLTAEEKELLYQVQNGEDLEKALQDLGKWNDLPVEDKSAVLKGEVDPEVANGIQSMGLWSNAEFVDKFASIDTNADDATDKIGKLLEEWGVMSAEEYKKLVVDSQDNGQQAIETVQEFMQLPDAEKMLHATDQTADGVATATNNILSVPEARNTFFTAQESLTPVAGNVNVAIGSVPISKHTNFGASEQVSANASSAKGAHASVPTSKHTNFGSSEQVSSKASSARSAHSSVPTSKQTNFNSSENVSSTAASARGAISSVPTSKTTTFTAKLAGAWGKVKSFFGYERGTNFHPGGWAMVNDQKGSRFREMIEYPDGTQYVPTGRNVIMDLPRGSKVLKASSTATMFPGLPQYADGVGITNDTQFIRDSTSLERANVPTNVNMPTIDLKPLEALLERINDSIQEGKIINNEIVMNRRKMTEELIPAIDQKSANRTNMIKRGVAVNKWR